MKFYLCVAIGLITGNVIVLTNQVHNLQKQLKAQTEITDQITKNMHEIVRILEPFCTKEKKK